MTYDDKVLDLILDAYEADDAAEFKRLMIAHPEFVNYENADWIYSATRDGKLPMLKVLIQLGRDVNERHFPDVPETDPFCELEGPILDAVTLGHDEIVEWLLEQGAQINYVVNGAPRCMPLIAAAGDGNLRLVKALIAADGDVNSVWQGLSPIEQARKLGKTEVLEYLLSLQNG